MISLARPLEAFFIDRLMHQRQASPHTVASYRDTFRLLLGFLHRQLGKPPSELDLENLDAPLIGTFLEDLEKRRHNSVRTRNVRLAAIHSFFRYAALQAPEHSALIQRVLAIPHRRCDRALVTFLTPAETEALLTAPGRRSWIARRDHALLLLAVQTGLRVSELTRLSVQDVQLGSGAHVRCYGKGRKEHCTPLTAQTLGVLWEWLRERNAGPSDPLFPSRHGSRLSRDAVERLLHKYVALAQRCCASLSAKRISPHVLRHTSAMRLLQAGVDRSVIALWLGHESAETTEIYLHADLSMKERALERTAPLTTPRGRYRAPDPLLAFLEAL
ncbi:MAG: tyrosine-type recombinase/integrase [Acidobacteria bacterium]|nr:tyrosine-type recombinase/integrase [Acidobacteriota bacterium]